MTTRTNHTDPTSPARPSSSGRATAAPPRPGTKVQEVASRDVRRLVAAQRRYERALEAYLSACEDRRAAFAQVHASGVSFAAMGRAAGITWHGARRAALGEDA